MLKLLLFSFLTIISFSVSAQLYFANNKVLHVYNDSYQNLTNDTVLADAIDWDDPDYAIKVNFPFSFNGIVFDSLISSSNIGLGADLQNKDSDVASIIFNNYDVVNRYNSSNLDTNLKSTISYKEVSTSEGNIIKVQFKNVGLFDDSSNTAYSNFQYWFHQKDSMIEFRYGKSSVDTTMFANYFFNEFHTLILALNIDFNTGGVDKMYYLNNINQPKVDSMTIVDFSNGTFGGFSRMPDSGTVYRIGPLQNTSINQFKLSDNYSVNTLVNNTLKIVSKNVDTDFSISIYSMDGKLCKTNQSNGGVLFADLSMLAPANYNLVLQDKKNLFYSKIVKQ